MLTTKDIENFRKTFNKEKNNGWLCLCESF